MVETNEILNTFLGTFLALLTTAIVWSLKIAYEKHRAEVLALAKYERMYANNLTIMNDNFDFLNAWIQATKDGRPYSIHFEDYFIIEEETYKISNLALVNSLLATNYMLRRTSLDFTNLYKSYWETLLRINENRSDSREQELSIFNKNILATLERIATNRTHLQNSMIEVVALIRAVDHVRRHSLFGYLGLLFVDAYPRVTKNSVEEQKKLLNENIDKKMHLRGSTPSKISGENKI